MESPVSFDLSPQLAQKVQTTFALETLRMAIFAINIEAMCPSMFAAKEKLHQCCLKSMSLFLSHEQATYREKRAKVSSRRKSLDQNYATVQKHLQLPSQSSRSTFEIEPTSMCRRSRITLFISFILSDSSMGYRFDH
jgi:hypothetical protein